MSNSRYLETNLLKNLWGKNDVTCEKTYLFVFIVLIFECKNIVFSNLGQEISILID